MDQIPTPVWEDQKLNQYFKTLPVFVQETIAQTGIQITDCLLYTSDAADE